MRSRSSSIDSKTAIAPASRSSSAPKPPVITAIVSMPALLGRLDVPRRVADHHRVVGAGLLQRGVDEVGLGLGLLDVVGARPGVDDVARVEQVEVVVELVGLRRAGEDDRVARVLEVDDEVARALERLDLLDHRQVERLLGGADVVAELLGLLLADQVRDELVAAHPDRAVDPPDRQDDLAAGGTRGTRRARAGSSCRRACRRCRGWRPGHAPTTRLGGPSRIAWRSAASAAVRRRASDWRMRRETCICARRCARRSRPG